MNSESYQIETRRRSRSKTPFLRSSCDHENCEHAGEEGHVHHTKKKSSATPNVQTIIEERVEVSSSSTTKVPTTKSSQEKSNLIDFTIGEQLSGGGRVQRTTQGRKGIAATASSAVVTTGSSSSATTVTKTVSQTIVTKSKKSSGGPAISTSTPKESHHVNKLFEEKQQQKQLNETSQNILNSVQEKQQQNEQQQQHQSRSKLFSFYSSFIGNKSNSNIGNGDVIADHIAYQDYKRAGEYWNVTPKTDYTYSELSPHRRELAPGVVAMPNMSRRSLENHSERVNFMVARNPSQEQYIRRRYEADYTSQRRHEAANLNYDSTDEVDITQFSNQRRHQYGGISETSWFMRIITTIVTTITTVCSKVTGGGDANQEEGYYRRIYGRQQQQQKLGFIGSIYHGITSGVLSLCRYVYMFISSVLLLDTILLKSSNADNKRKKRFLIFLLILLPLLLLAGWWLLDANDRQLYIQQTQTLLPISLLAGVRSGFYTAGTSLRGLIQLPGLIWPANNAIDEDIIAQEHLHKIEQNIQKSLTPEEYENILNHVNSYVQQLIQLKMKQQQSEQLKHAQSLTPGQTNIIVQLMRENLERVMEEQRAYDSSKVFVLSDAEVQRVASLVQLELKTHGDWPAQPVRLTVENLDEIKKLIKQQIDIHNHAHYTLLVERIDLDALLARILGAKQLADFVDARINAAIDNKITQIKIVEGSGGGKVNAEYEQQQAHLINDLNKEIAFIKLALSDKQSEVADLHYSISDLKLTQDNLLKRMQNHELATDKRFIGLLAEIESKLATLNDTQFALLNKQVKLTLVEILGFKQSTETGDINLDDIDLQNWVRSTFVAKEHLEEHLMDLNKRTNNLIRDEIERSSILMMRDISEKLKSEIILFVESKHNQSADTLKSEIREALSEQEVRNIVKSVLSVYDADKTGLVDFALESAGGQILSTRCTENFQTKSAQLSIFGIPLWYPTNTPRVAISPNVQPGECWAFQGFPGFLVLKLNTLVYVTGFSLEHIPKSLSPSGRIDSAPKTFTVWGLAHEKDQDPVQFGEYEYEDNDASLQYFPIQSEEVTRPYQIVELRIESNHGEPKYTCLYRFRVHGQPETT